MAKANMQILQQLGNSHVPLEHRSQQLMAILQGAETGNATYKALADEVFNRLTESAYDEAAKTRAKELDEMLAQLEATPLRTGFYLGARQMDDGVVKHALVALSNGDMAYVVAHNQPQLKELKLGDRVMVDAHSKILVDAMPNLLCYGQEARLERKIDEQHLEVVTHHDERQVVLANADLMRQVDTGEVSSGATLIISTNGMVALKALAAEKKSFFRFLDHGPVPDVVADRDIGSPPRVIRQVAQHIREEMTRPELRRKYRLRPCITRLLCGVSGTGKTLAVQAMHRQMYEIMSEVTGTPMAQLPPRVFRCRSSQMLSMWFGESDKNIDRMFDEVELVADEKWTSPSGNAFTLPVMVVLEEADGLGRARGQDNIYDRIMTVILQRLDPNREGLANKLVVFLSTTNEPHIVDPAFLRRIGGAVEIFGRLDARAFDEILKRHLDGLPLENHRRGAVRGIVERLNAWLFTTDEDKGVVELTYHGRSGTDVRYRRDFLTGALIDRAVQEAALRAWESATQGQEESLVTCAHIAKSINHQVLSVVNQLCPENAHSYVDLPEGVRVSSVRRIPQSTSSQAS